MGNCRFCSRFLNWLISKLKEKRQRGRAVLRLPPRQNLKTWAGAEKPCGTCTELICGARLQSAIGHRSQLVRLFPHPGKLRA